MIDTEVLRKKVIDLAIRGNLTQQLPEDGNAEDLYAQIQKEKAKLIKEGKIKKEKPLPEISDDEIPFEIPSNWKWIRMGKVIRVINGTSYAKTDVCDNGIRILRGGNIQDSKVLYNIDDVFIPDSYSDIEKTVQENDVLIVASTGSSTGIGKSGVVNESDDGTQIGAFLRIIRAYSPLISKYIALFFMSDEYKNKIRDLAKGMNINNIKESYITEMLLPFPPLTEQNRIVEKMQAIFALIDIVDEYQQQYESDQEILKGKIIDAGIRGKLTEQLPDDGDAEDLYDQIQTNKSTLIEEGKLRRTRGFKNITEDVEPYKFPKSWKICYIDDVAFVTKLAGFEYTKYIADSICEQGIPLFKGKNIQKGELILEFESFIPMEVSDGLPRSQVNKKCLLTPYVGTIGNIALFDGAFKAHLGSNVGKIEILNPSNVCLMEEFLLIYLRSDIGYSELNKHRKATAQDSISIDAIRNVIIAIPPIEEQRRIVNKISELLMIMEL